jgi:predicted nuclease of predicted toxin-antitoxin system
MRNSVAGGIEAIAVKFLVDMNLSPLWVEALAESDIASVHWSTVGDHGAPDSEIMAYALRHEMFVLTHDLDFSAILAATFESRPSVVQIRAMNLSPNVIGPQVVACDSAVGGGTLRRCARDRRGSPFSPAAIAVQKVIL